MMMDKVRQMNANTDYHPCIANELKESKSVNYHCLHCDWLERCGIVYRI